MISIKTKEELALMRASGRMLAEVLHAVIAKVHPGVLLRDLDTLAHDLIIEKGGIPSFKGYQQKPSDPPFPATMCASIDSELVHAPANRNIILQEGQIIGLDLGLTYHGWNADMAQTVPVGNITKDAERLITVTREALNQGIAVAGPEIPLNTICQTIYNYITKHRFGVVRGFSGHGIGKNIHEEPRVPNFPTEEAKNIILKPGMTIAIEPMVTAGDPVTIVKEDGWTAETSDKKLAAHFEHTIAITEEGAEILTLREA